MNRCDKCATPMVKVDHWLNRRSKAYVMKCPNCGYSCLIIPAPKAERAT